MNYFGGEDKLMWGSKKIKKQAKILTLIFTLSLSFSACSLGNNKSKAPALIKPVKFQYSLYEVKKGSIENVLETNGVLVSTIEEKLSFEAKNGKLKKLNVQDGDFIKKGQIVAELDNDEIDNRIKQQEINFNKIELRYNRMVKSKADETDVKQASIEMEQQRSQLEYLKKEIDSAKLISTMDGRVVRCTNISIGGDISSDDVIVCVQDINNMQIECTEKGIDKFKVDMNVNCTYKGKDYKSKVTQIEISEDNSKDKDKKEKTNNHMIVKMDKIPQGARLGDIARVYIEISKKENIIVIPKKFINKTESYNTVQILENGKKLRELLKLD